MSNEFKSLLPPNASKLLRDLEKTGSRLSFLEILNRYLRNPEKCLEHLLPWLGWALSVDVWNETWAESIRRNVIKASISVHRLKCIVEEKKNTDSLIEMLKINRHSYVVMDSDKKSSEDQLKDRVKRIQKEFPNAHWVTAGKEIDLPTEALHNYFDSSQNVEQFSFFPDIYKNIKKVETFDKVKFALDITKNKNYTKENLAKCLDLHEQTEMLIDFIRKSNQEIC